MKHLMNLSARIIRAIVTPLLFLSLSSSVSLGQSGTVHNKSFMQDGILRSYLLYVPAAYDGQEAWPLVINYHGFSSNATNQMNNHSKMNFVADTAHFIVAYPQGQQVELLTPIAGLPSTGSGWNVPGLIMAGQNDIAFTESLIDEVQRDFNIDESRIYATGWSNGSMMAFYLTNVLPNRIASTAGVAGPMTIAMIDSFSVTRSVSTLLIHGTADPIAPFDGIENFVPPASATPSFWARHNNCSIDSLVTELPDLNPNDGSTVTLIKYTGCNENTEVLFYRVNNGGHGWPGTGPDFPFLGNTNRDIYASSVIWNFFKRNPLPVSTGIADNAQNSPGAFQLYQNYPNPFNPSTTIKYSVAKAAAVELKIYDALGNLIRTLVDRHHALGEYSVVWDGKDANGRMLPSGSYFYRIKIGEVSAASKMTYLK